MKRLPSLIVNASSKYVITIGFVVTYRSDCEGLAQRLERVESNNDSQKPQSAKFDGCPIPEAAAAQKLPPVPDGAGRRVYGGQPQIYPRQVEPL
jgi:hypothetical protein